MPGDPEKCRANALRYSKLAERAKNPERRERLAALAETWTKLAAENEFDQALFCVLSELDFSEPGYAVPAALNLRAA